MVLTQISNLFIICCCVTYARSTSKNWWRNLDENSLIALMTMINWLEIEIEEFPLMIREPFFWMVLSMKITVCICWKILHFLETLTCRLSRILHLTISQLWDLKVINWHRWWWKSCYLSFWRSFCQLRLAINIRNK